MAKPHRHLKLRFDEEPRLDELLDDPMTHKVMARDRVTREELLACIAEARARLLPVEA